MCGGIDDGFSDGVNNEDLILTECDNCLTEVDIDITTSCEKCCKTLCPNCVCEDCYEE